MNKWKNRFINFEKSFNTLTQDIAKFNANLENVELHSLLRAGLIYVYEHTLELAWKTLKYYLEEQGFEEINSPKKAIRIAFKNEYIKDGELWIQAIDDRNLVTHDYDETIASSVVLDIRQKYYFLLSDLYHTLKNIYE